MAEKIEIPSMAGMKTKLNSMRRPPPMLAPETGAVVTLYV
jgi:hypothetical protein